jgi:hypothetical protein
VTKRGCSADAVDDAPPTPEELQQLEEEEKKEAANANVKAKFQ